MVRNIARRVREQGGEFVATGNVLLDAIAGRLDDPTGAYNIALKNNLTALSQADNWKEARKEWKATGNVWYVPMADDATEVLPSPHRESHPHYCICGHSVAWHFEIINTETGTVEIVGSEHIGFWMVVRHLIENLEIPEDEVTEEKVKQWVLEAVKSMKAEWWWKENGEEFETMFTAVREIDLFTNIRRGDNYHDNETQQMDYRRLIRKKAVGKMGTPDYEMASIVWRWNHTDNDKPQKETRGYPNERLWNDLLIFYFSLEKHTLAMAEHRQRRLDRIEEVKELVIRAKAAEEQRQKEYTERRRLQQIESLRRQAEEEEKILLAVPKFCEDNGIDAFTSEDGKNDWEKSFLLEMINKIQNEQFMSEKQRSRIVLIIKGDTETATEKQLAYIRSLGGEPAINLTKSNASKLIDELKNAMGKKDLVKSRNDYKTYEGKK